MDQSMSLKVEVDTNRYDDVVQKGRKPKNAIEKEVVVTEKVVPLHRSPPLFPQTLANKTKEGKQCMFITMLKKLSFNVLVIEALDKIPRYAKFMKEMVTKNISVSFEKGEKFKHCSGFSTR